jgi:hypothetical protein
MDVAPGVRGMTGPGRLYAGRMQAKAVIVREVERPHWRIWNSNARNARRILDRVRKVMHVFQGERSHRATAVPFVPQAVARVA